MLDIKKYSQDSIEAIKGSDFLVDEDWAALSGMQTELQDTFEKKQIWRTETEMEVSVLNDVKFPTRASKYWQSVREQSVFFENLVTLSFDYRRKLLKIKKIQIDLEQEQDDIEKELLQIDLEEANFAKKNMEVQAKDRMRELKLWSRIKSDLDDGSFDTKDVNTHQLVSYARRFIDQSIASSNNGSPAEKANLYGQLITAIKKCHERGILDKVYSQLPNNAKAAIMDIAKKSNITLTDHGF